LAWSTTNIPERAHEIHALRITYLPRMKLGAVIGRVTLSKAVPELQGARWLIVSPFTREHYRRGAQMPSAMGNDPSLVVYDELGAGVGQTIGYIEGREAAQPFDPPKPVDAINAALVDAVFYTPPPPPTAPTGPHSPP
jgi:microcompartment protein CcmK/EutM